MIGDLFGTGGTSEVIIVPDPIEFQAPSVVVPFSTESVLIQINPYGMTMPSSVAPNVEFTTSGSTFNGIDFETGAPISQSISPTVFTSQLPTAMINGGTPLTEHVGPDAPDLFNNPPSPGSTFELDQGSGPRQGDVVDFILATKPGLAAQQDDYIAVNGPGTFSNQTGESVTFENAQATLANDNGITGPDTASQIETVDEFYIQQEVHYDPGSALFTPDVEFIDVPPIFIDLPALGALPGANVGRQKLTENTSPIPQDRIFVNYSYFQDTPLQPDGVDVNRVTPGFETTFFNGMMSLELRTPFASTLTSDFVVGGLSNTNHTEFGNATMYLKSLIWRDETKVVSAGVGVAVPTASDFEIRTEDGQLFMEVRNEAVHALPFIGCVWTPHPRCFVQGICQFDIDTRGNSVMLSEFVDGEPTGRLLDVGRPDDADYVFFDLSMGYWMYQNQCGRGLLRGFAPMVELHYNHTMDRADSLIAYNGSSLIVSDVTQDTNLFNGVVGATALLTNHATVTVAYATPLNNNDKQFEGELRIMVNFLFGGPNPGFLGLF